MKIRQSVRTEVCLLAAVVALAAATGCDDRGDSAAGSGAASGEKQEAEKGRHGGRQLRDGDFALEVTIYERGVPPEFRVYSFRDDEPIDPGEVDLTVRLARFGGRVDTIQFTKRDDYLLGNREVEEPHSFDVELAATEGGKTHRWSYPSHEARTELDPEAIRTSGIEIEVAGPATITRVVRAHGRIEPNQDRMIRVTPRYPGVVREVRKRLGEPVGRGEALATVESNESLQRYEVPSPIAGTVLEKNTAPGEIARSESPIYTVGDLTSVWVDLRVPYRDFQQLRVGQPVTVEAGEGIGSAVAEITYLSPVGSEDTQTLLARAALANPDGRWRPGLFVSGEIVVDRADVAVAVRPSALQTFRDWDVVFLTDGKIFQGMPVEIGRRDKEWAEIVKGVAAGQRYVAKQSFLVKADVGKSGATHDH